MAKTEYEPIEVEDIEDLMDDFDLGERNTLRDLLQALEEDDCD